MHKMKYIKEHPVNEFIKVNPFISTRSYGTFHHNNNLTYKCTNFIEITGISFGNPIECDLYCIEKNTLVGHGDINWIMTRFGDEYGFNIINRNEVQFIIERCGVKQISIKDTIIILKEPKEILDLNDFRIFNIIRTHIPEKWSEIMKLSDVVDVSADLGELGF